MSYDLIPVNKKVEGISIGAFSWPIMLQETGMGYVLGYGDATKPGSYVYSSGKKGSPASNDGYKVSAFEAKAMAAVARGYVSVQRFIAKEHEQATDEQKVSFKTALFPGDDGTVRKLYKQPVHEDVLKRIEKFADFAENSKGFSIH